jgi:metallo-beta-lactamase class B
VIFVCSITAPGYNLIDNPKYPNIISDYNATFERLKKTPVDVFLASHGNAYDLQEKILKLKAGAENPFIDRDGYRAYLERSEEAFRARLARQKAEKK